VLVLETAPNSDRTIFLISKIKAKKFDGLHSGVGMISREDVMRALREATQVKSGA
jgi:hypothetical protein